MTTKLPPIGETIGTRTPRVVERESERFKICPTCGKRIDKHSLAQYLHCGSPEAPRR